MSFLSRLEVRYRGADVLRIEADTSVSENPSFGFILSGDPGGEQRGGQQRAGGEGGEVGRSRWAPGH